MDESLDDYISKSNFKVKIGNPSFKGNRNTPGNKRTFGLQTKKAGAASQITPLKNVSVTVPVAAVQKTGGNINKTNQIRDARERILSKGTPQDARQKIQERVQGGDARQKLTMIRSQKGPVDARAKLQAKKQQNEQVVTGPAGFMVTRTVSNSNQVPMAPQGAPGHFQITKTLTKIMPPGYEGLVEGPAEPPPLIHTPQTRPSVKHRLGPKQGPGMKTVVNLTRTVPGNLQAQSHDLQRPPFVLQGPPPGPMVQQGYAPPHQAHQFPPNSPPVRYAPPPVHYAGAAPPPPHIQQGHVQYGSPPNGPPPNYPLGPPQHHNAPPLQHAMPLQHAPPPQQAHLQHYPPPQQAHLQHYPPPHGPSPPQGPPQQGSPPHVQTPPPRMIMTVQHQPPPHVEGPPYPVNDDIPIKRTVAQEIQRPNVPVIQIKNDQYRPPPPQYPQYAPPTPTYTQPYPYPEPAPQSVPQQQPYYTHTDTSLQRTVPNTDTSLRRTVPNREPAETGSFRKTIVNETAQYSPPRADVSSLKRKSPGGPLRLSSTNTHPVLSRPESGEGGARPSASRYTKPIPRVPEEPVIKKAKPQSPAESEVISPLQGFKIVISNLHVTVTQDDVIELFGAIGPVKKVKLVKPGTAEVTYVKRDDALEATKTYHERELDGQPMVVKMATSMTAKVKEVPEKLPPDVKPLASGPLKLNKKPAGMAKVSDKPGVEVGVLHKALFKTGSSSSAKPVTFTVNI